MGKYLNVDIVGKLFRVLDPREAGSATLQEFVVEQQDAEYPNYWLVQLWGDKAEQLDKYRLGDEIVCHCSLRGTRYLGKEAEMFFLGLSCWGIGKPKADTTEPQIAKLEEKEASQRFQDTRPEPEDPRDDLPF